MRTRLVPCAALVLASAAACGGDDSSPATTAPAPPATVPVTAPPVPTTAAAAPVTTAAQLTVPAPTDLAAHTFLAIDDEHLAFDVALPDHHAVVGSGTSDVHGDGSCVAYWWHLDGAVLVEAWPAGCEPDRSQPGNGNFGHYRTLADAPTAVPTGSASSALGPAALAEQPYYECTNSCDEWMLDLAVIELSEPVDPEYPTLAVIMTGRESTGRDLVALLDAFGAG